MDNGAAFTCSGIWDHNLLRSFAQEIVLSRYRVELFERAMDNYAAFIRSGIGTTIVLRIFAEELFGHSTATYRSRI